MNNKAAQISAWSSNLNFLSVSRKRSFYLSRSAELLYDDIAEVMNMFGSHNLSEPYQVNTFRWRMTLSCNVWKYSFRRASSDGQTPSTCPRASTNPFNNLSASSSTNSVAGGRREPGNVGLRRCNSFCLLYQTRRRVSCDVHQLGMSAGQRSHHKQRELRFFDVSDDVKYGLLSSRGKAFV